MAQFNAVGFNEFFVVDRRMKTVRHCFALSLIFVLSLASIHAEDSPQKSDLPVRVAVFNDSGVSPKVTGLVDLLKTFPEVAATELKGEHIRAGQLKNFDVVLFPGGSGSGEAKALEATGRDEVRTFVERGGGYLGICAGAYLASADYDWSLHILDAKVLDRAHWARGTGDVELTITTAGQRLLAASERETVLYWQGPLLAPAGKAEIPDYETLGTFATEIAKNGAPKGVMPGTTAIARGQFGAGRVFCFSPHPERSPGLQRQVLSAILWAAKK